MLPDTLSDEEHMVARQAFSGMLWSKQYYLLDVERWLVDHGADPLDPDPRLRNHEWRHMVAEDVISMPDKWEYPWFAAWDLAFHTVAFAPFDAGFAKDQLRSAPEPPLLPPQRAAARLRVELQRRQPAGARMGDAARVRAGEGTYRQGGLEISSRAPSRS